MVSPCVGSERTSPDRPEYSFSHGVSQTPEREAITEIFGGSGRVRNTVDLSPGDQSPVSKPKQAKTSSKPMGRSLQRP